MPIIPSSLASAEHATFGEKKLHRILHGLYADTDDAYAWYEPPALTVNGGRDNSRKIFTDFILFSQSFGILNLEVKDWKPERIKKGDKQFWEIETEDGKLEKKDSPFEQSRRCAYAIKDRLIKEEKLTHKAGEYKGKLLFPFGWGVVLTHFKRADLKIISGLDEGALEQVLCKDDLDFEMANKDERLAFEKKLRGMFSNWFEFEPLSDSRVNVLRKSIWPELVITPVQKPLFQVDNADLRILDLEQEDFAKSLGEGHYLIRGVVGSGKTLVLAYRARFLLKLRRNWRVLFLCYNKALKNYISKILDDLGEGIDSTKIEISHFHELVSNKTCMSVAHRDGETAEAWDERVGRMLLDTIEDNKVAGHRYDAILIDEAQDFSTEWLKATRGLLNETNSLIVAYDPAQDFYHRKRVWREAGIDVLGRRSRKLKQSYRSTSEILKLAVRFRGFEDYIAGDEENPDSVLMPEEIEIHGQKPILQKFPSYQSLFQGVAKKVQELIATGRYSYRDIGVIVTMPFTAKKETSAFSEKNIPFKSLLASDERSSFDMDEDTVKIITIESSKGLEWKVVFLVGIELMPRKNRDEKYETVLVYVGITRARELLHIYFTKTNQFLNRLNEINSSL